MSKGHVGCSRRARHRHSSGVSYRDSAQKQAQRTRLSGWVRDTSDGALELLASAPVPG
ncbi:acylphosphatase [Nesterenkonia sp. NBAIMH1]|uniref:acylphosphatase n=1 Tax=Nesterenkonia sp. NBAIMH1 TaxID=2600320 RepID=UPI0011B3CCCC